MNSSVIRTPGARIAAALAAHPELAVHLATVDELDDDDAAMIEQAIAYVARRSAQQRAKEA